MSVFSVKERKDGKESKRKKRTLNFLAVVKNESLVHPDLGNGFGLKFYFTFHSKNTNNPCKMLKQPTINIFDNSVHFC